ncbi:DUF481 domain-containing protein [Rubritalea marina]|uniref:DUF481 domain-containing protein n=1 Tax=Rubritalea marina TaxID=361055 RepID=UPI000380519D|nr:DUF481 domain-containing protein [Rubritalea marina]
MKFHVFKKNSSLFVCAVSSALLVGSVQAEDEVVEAAPSWESSVDFGLSAAQGNTENLLFRFGLKTEKKDDIDAYLAELSYKYGEESGTANEDEIIGKAKWNHILEGKNYFGLGLEGRRDTFADINYRVSLNATYGYYFIDTDRTVLTAEAGLGVTTEDLGQGADTYLNGLIEQSWKHKISDFANVYETLSYSPRLDNLSDYRLELEAGLETKITQTITLKLGLENRYASVPATDKKKNDLKVFSSLSYKF